MTFCKHQPDPSKSWPENCHRPFERAIFLSNNQILKRFHKTFFLFFFFNIYILYFKPNTWKHKQVLKPLPLNTKSTRQLTPVGHNYESSRARDPSSQDLPLSLPPSLPSTPSQPSRHPPAEVEGEWGAGGSGTVHWQLPLYVRFSVWKIREICNITGPVSGSFIHWVLFKGFSSISSKAAKK